MLKKKRRKKKILHTSKTTVNIPMKGSGKLWGVQSNAEKIFPKKGRIVII